MILLVCALALTAIHADGHVMSLSSGELRLDGAHAELAIEVPLYEVSDLEKPESTVLDSFVLSSSAGEAKRLEAACETVESEGAFRCRASYALDEEPASVEVECRLAETVVSGHVHVLRAFRGDDIEQKVFDYTHRRHTFRFRALTPFELVTEAASAGFWRALGGPLQALFILALAAAARSRRELLVLLAAFVAAEAATAILASWQGWRPPARFLEAAAALTVAYIGVETLALPEASGRWLVAGGMGVFHGLAFGVFLQQTEFAPAPFLGGVAAAEGGLLALFAGAKSWLGRAFGERRTAQALAGLLIVVGLVWFGFRLRS